MNTIILVVSVIIFVFSVGYIIYNTFFTNTNLKRQYISIITMIVMLILIITSLFTYKEKEVKTVAFKKSEETIVKKVRLNNDDLSSMSAEDIFNSYSDSGKERINKIFGDDDIAKNYSLTLVGKTLSELIFNDINNEEVPIEKKSIVLILNRGDESKKFVSTLNNIDFDKNVQYLILFPTESNKDVSEFVKENKINDNWKIIAKENNDTTVLQPDLFKVAKYYFNVIGTPSYASIYDSTITLAGNGSSDDLFKKFNSNAFEEPFLYDLVLEK